MNMRSPFLSLMAVASATWLAACSGGSGVTVDMGGPGSGSGGSSPSGSGGAASPAGSGGDTPNPTGSGGMMAPEGCAGTSGTGSGGSPGSAGSDGGASQGTGGISMAPYMKPAPVKSAGCDKPTSPGAGTRSITVAGRNINYIVEAGGYDHTMPNKLIFTLHGCGGYGGLSHLPGLAPNIHVQWAGQDSGCYSDQTRDSPEYAVFDALLEYMESNYCIDTKRVFATGFSSGSWMADMLGCRRADKVKAHGQGAGGLPATLRPAADCRGPEAALFEHGTGDDQNHVHGSKMDIDRLLRVNQCDRTSKPYPGFSPCILYDNCLPGYPVAYCEIPGLGHSPWGQMNAVIGNFFQQF